MEYFERLEQTSRGEADQGDSSRAFRLPFASLTFGYEIYGNECTTIDLLAGATINSIDVDLELFTPLLPVTIRSASGSQDWIDPSVGLRVRHQLSDLPPATPARSSPSPFTAVLDRPPRAVHGGASASNRPLLERPPQRRFFPGPSIAAATAPGRLTPPFPPSRASIASSRWIKSRTSFRAAGPPAASQKCVRQPKGRPS